MARIETDRLIKIFKAFDKLVVPEVRSAPLKVSLGMVRIETDCLFVTLYSFVALTLCT